MGKFVVSLVGVALFLGSLAHGSKCPEQESITRHVLCYYEGRTLLGNVNLCNCTHIILTNAVQISDNNSLHFIQGAEDNLHLIHEKKNSIIKVFTLEAKKELNLNVLESENKSRQLIRGITDFIVGSLFDGIELSFPLKAEDPVSKESVTSFVKVLRKELGNGSHSRVKRDGYGVSENVQDDITTASYRAKLVHSSEKQSKKPSVKRRKSHRGSRDESTESGKVTRPHRMRKELREDVPDSVAADDSKNLLLVRLSINPEVLGKKFDLKALSKYSDLMVVPTHNITDQSETHLTYHPSRLMGLSDMLNADSILDFLTGLGVTKSKLVLTLPATILKFHLQDSKKTTPRSQAIGQFQVIDHSQLCELFSRGEWTVERDEDLTAPYAFSGDTWLAYEDRISTNIKAKYIILRELAGAGVYPIDADTGKDPCNETADGIGFLTNTLYKNFGSLDRKPRGLVLQSLQQDIHDTSYSSAEVGVHLSEYRIVRVVDHSGAVHVIRKNTKTQFECSRQGYFSHPLGCNKFYRCVKFDQYVDDFTVFEYDCPAGLAFDERWEVCVWPGSLPHGAPCTGSSEIAPVPRAHYQCPNHEGYYADPENCRWFFACLDHARDGVTPLTAYEFRCPFGLVFNEKILACDWPWNVGGCGAHGHSGVIIEHHGGIASSFQSATYIDGESSSSSSGQGTFHAAGGADNSGYIASHFDDNQNRASFGTFPDYELSGGRILNHGGFVLGHSGAGVDVQYQEGSAAFGGGPAAHSSLQNSAPGLVSLKSEERFGVGSTTAEPILKNVNQLVYNPPLSTPRPFSVAIPEVHINQEGHSGDVHNTSEVSSTPAPAVGNVVYINGVASGSHLESSLSGFGQKVSHQPSGYVQHNVDFAHTTAAPATAEGSKGAAGFSAISGNAESLKSGTVLIDHEGTAPQNLDQLSTFIGVASVDASAGAVGSSFDSSTFGGHQAGVHTYQQANDGTSAQAGSSDRDAAVSTVSVFRSFKAKSPKVDVLHTSPAPTPQGFLSGSGILKSGGHNFNYQTSNLDLSAQSGFSGGYQQSTIASEAHIGSLLSADVVQATTPTIFESSATPTVYQDDKSFEQSKFRSDFDSKSQSAIFQQKQQYVAPVPASTPVSFTLSKKVVQDTVLSSPAPNVFKGSDISVGIKSTFQAPEYLPPVSSSFDQSSNQFGASMSDIQHSVFKQPSTPSPTYGPPAILQQPNSGHAETDISLQKSVQQSAVTSFGAFYSSKYIPPANNADFGHLQSNAGAPVAPIQKTVSGVFQSPEYLPPIGKDAEAALFKSTVQEAKSFTPITSTPAPQLSKHITNTFLVGSNQQKSSYVVSQNRFPQFSTTEAYQGPEYLPPVGSAKLQPSGIQQNVAVPFLNPVPVIQKNEGHILSFQSNVAVPTSTPSTAVYSGREKTVFNANLAVPVSTSTPKIYNEVQKIGFQQDVVPVSTPASVAFQNERENSGFQNNVAVSVSGPASTLYNDKGHTGFQQEVVVPVATPAVVTYDNQEDKFGFEQHKVAVPVTTSAPQISISTPAPLLYNGKEEKSGLQFNIVASAQPKDSVSVLQSSSFAQPAVGKVYQAPDYLPPASPVVYKNEERKLGFHQNVVIPVSTPAPQEYTDEGKTSFRQDVVVPVSTPASVVYKNQEEKSDFQHNVAVAVSVPSSNAFSEQEHIDLQQDVAVPASTPTPVAFKSQDDKLNFQQHNVLVTGQQKDSLAVVHSNTFAQPSVGQASQGPEYLPPVSFGQQDINGKGENAFVYSSNVNPSVSVNTYQSHGTQTRGFEAHRGRSFNFVSSTTASPAGYRHKEPSETVSFPPVSYQHTFFRLQEKPKEIVQSVTYGDAKSGHQQKAAGPISTPPSFFFKNKEVKSDYEQNVAVDALSHDTGFQQNLVVSTPASETYENSGFSDNAELPISVPESNGYSEQQQKNHAQDVVVSVSTPAPIAHENPTLHVTTQASYVKSFIPAYQQSTIEPPSVDITPANQYFLSYGVQSTPAPPFKSRGKATVIIEEDKTLNEPITKQLLQQEIVTEEPQQKPYLYEEYVKISSPKPQVISQEVSRPLLFKKPIIVTEGPRESLLEEIQVQPQKEEEYDDLQIQFRYSDKQKNTYETNYDSVPQPPQQVYIQPTEGPVVVQKSEEHLPPSGDEIDTYSNFEFQKIGKSAESNAFNTGSRQHKYEGIFDEQGKYQFNANIEIAPPPQEYFLDQTPKIYSTTPASISSTENTYFRPRGRLITLAEDELYRTKEDKSTVFNVGQVDKDEYDEENVESLLEKYSGDFGDKFVTKIVKGQERGEFTVGRNEDTSTIGYEVGRRKSYGNGREEKAEDSTVASLDLKNLKLNKNKKTVIVVTQVSDSNPLIVGKLAGQCSCRSNTINLRKKGYKPKSTTYLPPTSSDGTGDEYTADSLAVEAITPSPSAVITQTTENVVLIDGSKTKVVTRKRRPKAKGKPREDITSGNDVGYPIFPPVPAEEIATTADYSKQSAGAAFDRYGPGGLRGFDETLQGSVDCVRPGLFRHPKHCNKFYACNYDPWKKRYTLHVFNCPIHLSYDSSISACNWPSKGPACSDDNLLI